MAIWAWVLVGIAVVLAVAFGVLLYLAEMFKQGDNPGSGWNLFSSKRKGDE